MDLIMLLLVAMGIAVSVANKKKKAEEQRKRAAFPEKGNPVPGSASGRDPQKRSTAKTPASSKSTTLSQRPSAPGTSKWPWPTQQEAKQQKKAATPSYGGTPKYTHVVTSTLEGGHTHTESSMTGEEACPLPKPATVQPAVETAPIDNAGVLVNFQPNDVLRGVLYAEILGKPKALQRK